ncbi:MAG: hypothetical protein HWD61_08260 [Parachlamydiaceae bacterium]|nr:MAG: hypothetical protein HWD61_08260 [Parachlamydiaceae bacterium]
MKQKLISTLLFSVTPFICFANSTESSDKIPYTLHAEHDKTDIYAIPVDSSEAEEEEEQEHLEEIQQEEQAKK